MHTFNKLQVILDPLLPYLLTPKQRQPEGSPSARYTNAHIRTRSCIERAIGMLKGRWRCLRKERALHYSPEFSGKRKIHIY
jgi:nuclease HARBI1